MHDQRGSFCAPIPFSSEVPVFHGKTNVEGFHFVRQSWYGQNFQTVKVNCKQNKN
jgi:hypothetical protein